MSGRGTPISISILDKEYRIACSEGEQDTLRAAARFLNEQMRIVREGGIIGNERIAVMAALNLASDLLACRSEKVDYTQRTSEVLQRMRSKLSKCV